MKHAWVIFLLLISGCDTHKKYSSDYRHNEHFLNFLLETRTKIEDSNIHSGLTDTTLFDAGLVSQVHSHGHRIASPFDEGKTVGLHSVGSGYELTIPVDMNYCRSITKSESLTRDIIEENSEDDPTIYGYILINQVPLSSFSSRDCNEHNIVVNRSP